MIHGVVHVFGIFTGITGVGGGVVAICYDIVVEYVVVMVGGSYVVAV